MRQETNQPILRTSRLTLRAFVPTDAQRVQELAGSRLVAATVPLIPHPYEDGMADAWIASHPTAWRDGSRVTFAIDRADDGNGVGLLIGAISLVRGPYSQRTAELGYWIGHPYWGNGFATEAATEVVRFGLTDLDLLRIHASHMSGNDASGRILEKLGFRPEGRRPLHVERFGEHHDLYLFGLVRTGVRAASPTGM